MSKKAQNCAAAACGAIDYFKGISSGSIFLIRVARSRKVVDNADDSLSPALFNYLVEYLFTLAYNYLVLNLNLCVGVLNDNIINRYALARNKVSRLAL